MEISIRYLTTFTYDTHVSESHNALRACPADDDVQRLVRYAVTVDPEARIASYTDYWGTRVDTFGVVGNHTRLTVVADAVVETAQPAAPEEGGGWPAEGGGLDAWHAYLVPSPHVEWDAEVADFGREVTAGDDTMASCEFHLATGLPSTSMQ